MSVSQHLVLLFVSCVCCAFLSRFIGEKLNFFITTCSVKIVLTMDIYGYQSYQYNQSDELTKQILAQQALAMPCRGIPEPHIMPAPSGSPWNVQGVPWGMPSPPQVVQFTAQTDAKLIPEASPVIHCKRKSLDPEPVIPAKQLITEEKMAAHLSGLHISSDYTSHTLASDEVMDFVDNAVPSTSTQVSDKLKGHKIVLSEEVKKLKDEPLLPATLIERLEKPKMSLVLWKPKEDILEKIIEEKQSEKEKKEEEEGVKRNGVLVGDFPGMDVEM